jgi:NAD(P)-dependent dehydrogenase (short-subunit alcohol dehydrogenase family)
MSSGQRTIVVTGVTGGLGRALLARLVEAGHRVAGCGRRAGRVRELRARFPGALLAEVDVADAAAVDRWAREVVDALGAPDLLVNNAALMNEPAPLWEVPAAEFDALLRVNVSGVANAVRSFVPAMIAAAQAGGGPGVVANFSSGWGRSTSPEVGPYCASKWAIEGFTRSLAQELPFGLAAVAVNPGIIDTPMLRTCWGDDAAAYPGAEEWSRAAAPFLLALGAADSGRSLDVG